MDGPATLRETRESRSLSQEQFAIELGLQSKGYVSRIETGEITPSLRLALRIERWSGGCVRAESLLSPDDADLLNRTAAPGLAPGIAPGLGADSPPDSRGESPFFAASAECPA